MPKFSREDEELRERIAKWLEHFERMYKPHDLTRKAFAQRVHLSASTVSDILNREATVGIGIAVLVRMRKYLKADLNLVVEEDPPLSLEATPDPLEVSPATATRGRRKEAGGR